MQRIRIVSLKAMSKGQKFWNVYGDIHKQIGVYAGEDVGTVYLTETTIPELAENL